MPKASLSTARYVKLFMRHYTSLVVAIIAWLTARRTARVQAEFQRKLEALRLAEGEVAPAQAAANVLWKELQTLKQALDVLLVDGHPESEDAVEAAYASATALSKDYAHRGQELPRHIRDLWHGIKNRGHEVEEIVREYKNIARSDRAIPLEEKGRILAVRHSLTQSQRYLEERLSEHRLEVQKKYADLLRPGVEL